MKYLSFLLASLVTVSYAAEVVNVSGKVMLVDFNQKRVELFVPAYKGLTAGSRVCLQGKTEVKQHMDLKCGKLLSVDKQKTVVEVAKGGMTFQLGQVISVLSENKMVGEERMIASYYDSMTGQMPARNGLAAGMTFGLNYFFPSVHLEFATSPSVTFGVLGVYGDSQSNNTRNKTYGGLFSFTYYAPQPSLGLNFELLGGAYSSLVEIGSSSETITSYVGAALLGWKGFLAENLHYRVSAGAQYVSNSTTPQFLNYSGVMPFFRAEVGVSF